MNLMLQNMEQRWHTVSTKTLSQGFISRATVHVMFLLLNVFSGLGVEMWPGTQQTQTLPLHLRQRLCYTPCLYVCSHTCSCQCVCGYVCSGEGSSGSRWPGRLLYYFWEGCSFPLEGLIEECWLSPSPPLRLRDFGQARPSGPAGCSSTQLTGAVACTQPSTHSTTLHTDG